ncbi:transpeptidase [Geotalea daltonii FRC-32]|uniref:Transpeptidase n=1 Tax=Geotalea daltonii (strain DSM 22248 / JCM 15807 / FRC-32) TaxID=316067 RepID=B9M1B8_GEODF|nr:penicillin-binding transpeptidase domain-containing protein [Geotalea daltonii]ACM19188.1 transpeptidase [Geotalea daltonii FRC-32]
MQDLKHLSKKKRLHRLNLRKQQDTPASDLSAAIKEPPAEKKRLRLALPIIALLLASYPIFNLLISAKTALSSVSKSSMEAAKKPDIYKELDNWRSFQLAADMLPSSSLTNDHLSAALPDGGTVVYAIDEPLQRRITNLMEDFKVPYGAFVAIEPKTGKILALASHSSINPAWEKSSCFNLYPMASLFKIITATAALEQKKVSPDTVFAFNGRLTSENPKYWYVKAHGKNQELPLSIAMGKSVNPVFGRLASDVVGKDSLISCAERFGFNQLLFPGTPVIPSRAAIPQTDSELKLMGAGLGREVKISPVHAAAVMAAIANGGIMMAPSLVEEVKNPQGNAVFSHKPEQLKRLVAPEVTGQLSRMLSTTVNSGTSRRAFHDRRGRPMLASINIAAKTGSINGNDPAGHYSWFAAYAPIEDPQIALVALVINQNKWRIKASNVGEKALEAFFKR